MVQSRQSTILRLLALLAGTTRLLGLGSVFDLLGVGGYPPVEDDLTLVGKGEEWEGVGRDEKREIAIPPGIDARVCVSVWSESVSDIVQWIDSCCISLQS